MRSPANASYNEDYWRDRCGMPPRADEDGRPQQRRSRSFLLSLCKFITTLFRAFMPAARQRPMTGLSSGRPDRADARGLQLLVESAQLHGPNPAAARARTGARAAARYTMLKTSLALLGAVWIAGAAAVAWHLAPENAELAASFDALTQAPPASMAWFAMPLPAGAPDHHEMSKVQADGMMASFDRANQVALTALRGYLLTGSAGFHNEWEAAMRRFDAAQTAIEVDSRGWTQGERIVELRDMRKTVAVLRHEAGLLVGIAVTPNRFPGLRLYREDTDPALERATVLIDETLRSVLASNWAGAAGRVDELAHIRADIRAMRAGLDFYLPSRAMTPPGGLIQTHGAFLAELPKLLAMRDKVSPEDQGRIDRVHGLLTNAEAQLQQIMALKLTARWDYADFAFQQKVMPLSQNISATIAGWRAAG